MEENNVADKQGRIQDFFLEGVHSSLALLQHQLKGQCPDYAHARVSSVFSSKDNRTVKLTRQDFLPDRTTNRNLLFIFLSNI